MRVWIYTAVCLLIVGFLFPILRGDAEGAVEGVVKGLGVLAVVLLISGLIWVLRLPFKLKKKQ